MPIDGVLGSLLKRSVAKVVAEASGGGTGTAFRIAPEFAVTAAHVAGERGTRLHLTFDGEIACGGEVLAASSPPTPGSRWGFDDYAVIGLDRPELDTPCVPMAEPALQPTDELVVCALNPTYVEQAVEIYRDFHVRELHSNFFTIDGRRTIVQGMSGGPIWATEHTGIVGFVKASENLANPQGGAGVYLLAGLRRVCAPELYDRIVTAHDAYHRRDQRWADELTGHGATTRRRLIDIQGCLAGITDPVARQAPSHLVDELLPATLADPLRLATLRDLAEYLGTETQDRDMNLARLCAHAPAYLPDDPAVAEQLRAIAGRLMPDSQRAGFLSRMDARWHGGSATLTVFGVVLPEDGPRVDGRSRGPYRFEVYRRFGADDLVPLEQAGGLRDYRTVKRELQVALDRQLSTIRAPRDSIEVVVALPDEYLTEQPLYEWRRPDERPFAKFRMRLRRSRTWVKSNEQVAELDERWNRLEHSGFGGLMWLDCLDAGTCELAALHEILDPSGAGETFDGLAVTESPSASVLNASASNALPVTLWREERCADRTACGDRCPGAVFRGSVLSHLGGQPPTQWYSRIWSAQRETEESADRDRFWRRLVYLLDIPGQSKNLPPPLAGPVPRKR